MIFIVLIRDKAKQNVMSCIVEPLVLLGRCRCFKLISRCAKHFAELGH